MRSEMVEENLFRDLSTVVGSNLVTARLLRDEQGRDGLVRGA